MKKLKSAFIIAAATMSFSAIGVGSLLPSVSVMAETTAYNADISRAKAKEIALSHAKANASSIIDYKIELDRERNGVFYEIEFDYNGYEYEYKINASTGSIVEFDKEPVKKSDVKKSESRQVNNNAASYIGEAKAKSIALSHAKASAGAISRFKIDLDSEKGTVYYEVEFLYGGYEYEYEINARTGSVIKYEKELKDAVKAGYTGLAKNNSGQWIYYKKGKADTGFTGLAQAPSGQWYHVTKGKYNASYTGLSRAASGRWYYVKKGKYDTSFTGLAKAPSGQWYHVTKGKYNASYTGLSRAASGRWYYVKNGKYNTSYSGKVNYNGKTYSVKNGKVV